MRKLFVLSVIVTIAVPSRGQDWADREHGIGLVAVEIPATESSASRPSTLFYSGPSRESEIVARLDSDSLTLPTTGRSLFWYDISLEYAYEQAGLPILAFNADSSWARVSLDCRDMQSRTAAWLPVDGSNVTVKTWTVLLGDADAFFFLNDELIHFYSSPDTSSEIHIPLTYQYSRPNYQLYRKRVEGVWMLVELETPSSYCISEDEVMETFGVKPRRQLVWIRFLDDRGRPRVFYNTRGC